MNNPFPIFDGHNDLLLRICDTEGATVSSFFDRNKEGHLDLPRAREGGLAGGFFAIFVPWPTGQQSWVIDQTYALNQTVAMAADLFRIEALSDGQFKVVRDVPLLQKCLKNSIFAAIFHIEGAEAIDPDLNALEVLYQAGLRSLGIVWSRPNSFGTGVPFEINQSPDTGPGLSDLGKQLVKQCNQQGIMIDLSHLNEKGFWDVEKTSDAPLVATHSCAHTICPHTRNLTDKQLDAIAASGGVVGLNFAVANLRPDGESDSDTPIELMVQHMQYMADRMGIDHVALGSDFDGTKISDHIKDATGLPKLIDALKQGGFDAQALKKITHKNWLRVLEKTWR